MKPREVAKRLHENERKVLLALKAKGTSTTKELSNITELSRDAVEKASAWAETKGVLSFREEVSREFFLTDEGKDYINSGLPEKRLIKLVSEGKKGIPELREEIPNLNVALVWLHRNIWGSIEDGEIKLTNKGNRACKETIPEERLLKRLMASTVKEGALSPEEQEVMETLLSRNLVEQRDETERWIEVTDLGKEVIPHIEETLSRRVITQLTPEMLRNRDWREASYQRYDIALPAPSLNIGKRHFISQVIDYIRRFWIELGFREMKGGYLELSFWNFDALFQPQDHPARDLADTFYMKTPEKGRLPDEELVKRVKETHENGWTTGSTGWQYEWDPEVASLNCLRPHTTSLSVNKIARLDPDELPAKFFSVGRVFRNETIDWNHLIEFYQTDGIVVGKGVNFRNLQGYLKLISRGLV